MKKIKTDLENIVVKNYDDYKKLIDTLIANNEYEMFKRSEKYFELSRNYWLVDTYICKGGVLDTTDTPNTLSAYQKAIKAKYAICIHVQSLDDDNIVCFAHKNISKVIPTASGYLNRMSLKDIKKYSLNESNETIPTLDEALSVINGQVPVIITIVNDGIVGKMEDKVVATIDKYIKANNAFGKVAIMSINPYTLEYINRTYPYVTRILKCRNFQEKTYGSLSTKKLMKLKYIKITNADLVSYPMEKLPYRKLKKCNIVGVIAHTVKTEQQYLSIAPHCDNIIFTGFKPYI